MQAVHKTSQTCCEMGGQIGGMRLRAGCVGKSRVYHASGLGATNPGEWAQTLLRKVSFVSSDLIAKVNAVCYANAVRCRNGVLFGRPAVSDAAGFHHIPDSS